MDRIEQLMKNSKPHVPEPGTIPGVLTGRSHVFSDDPNVVSLAEHKRRRSGWVGTAGVVLAAAAVVGAVVVAGNLAPQSAPAPATTDTPTVTATPTATPSPSPTATPTPAAIPTAEATQVPTPTIPAVATTAPVAPPVPAPTTVPPTIAAPPGPAAGACTVDNIDKQRQDQAPAIKPIPAEYQQYYTVLGCAEGWLAYSISDEGLRAQSLDGGNAWYRIAKLQNNGRYLDDYGQLWSSVYNWEFQTYAVQNGQYATAQEAMDKEFTDKGIPVRLRAQLVGPGPTTPVGTTP
ncbi:hypothetical protein [Paenarthrobacter nitroguajacolicus]